MELIGLDASFGTVKTLKCINIQWNRKYYEAGDYEIQIPASEWNETIAYIYASDRTETGMVEKVVVEHTIKGTLVNVSGYFLEGMLNWKIIYPKYKGNASIVTLCETLVTTYLPELSLTVLHNTAILDTDYYEFDGEQLGDATYAALKRKESTQSIVYSPAFGLGYVVGKGQDRTQSQSALPYAVFSQNNGTIEEMTLTRDSSAMRNFAQVLYDGGTFTIDLRTGSEPKRILLIDTGMSKEEDQTTADFLATVDVEARKVLAEYPSIINIEADIMQTNLIYRTDYNLGTKCDIRDDRLKLAFEARIIGVREVWKGGVHTISLEFGDKIPTTYRRR